MNIFVSNNRSNADLAEQLVQHLESEGHDVFYYVRDIATGTTWLEEQNKGLQKADVVIAILSEGYMNSKYCRMELAYAFEHDKLYPILVGPADLGQWNTIQYLDVAELYADNNLGTILEEFGNDFSAWIHGNARPLSGVRNPTSFEDDEIGIVFASFFRSEKLADSWHLRLRNKLRELAQSQNIKFLAIQETIDTRNADRAKARAQEILTRYNATLVVWGEYDEDLEQIEVNYTVRGMFSTFTPERQYFITDNGDHNPNSDRVSRANFSIYLTNGGSIPFVTKLIIGTLYMSKSAESLETALDFANQALAENVGTAGLRHHGFYLRAIIYSLLSNLTEALEDLNTAIEERPDEFLYYLARQWVYVWTQDMENALTDAKKLVSISPNEAFSFANLGAVHHAREEWSLALDAYHKAMSIDPKVESQLYVKLGMVALSTDSYDLALDHLTKGLESNPDDDWAQFLLAQTLLELKDYEQAYRGFNQICQSYPASILAHHLRAHCRLHLEDQEGALADINLAIELFRSRQDPRSQNVLVSYINSWSTGALPQMRASYAESTYPALLGTRARVHFDMKNFRAALDDLNEELEMQSTNFERSFRAVVARELVAQGQYDSGVQVIRILMKQATEPTFAGFIVAEINLGKVVLAGLSPSRECYKDKSLINFLKKIASIA